MMALLLVVHVIVCFVLIFVVLLQAGRGGGFSEMVGGGQPQSIFGTQTNTFMTRATEVSAALFIITSLSLGILTSQKSKSLVEKAVQSGAVGVSSPALPVSPAKAVEDVTESAAPAPGANVAELPAQVAATATQVASEGVQAAKALEAPVAEASKAVESVAAAAKEVAAVPAESKTP